MSNVEMSNSEMSNVKIISFSKLTVIWITLLLLTISTAIIGYLKLSGFYIAGFILLTVSIKGMLVIDHFMGLRNVQGYWRMAMFGFVTVIPAITLLAYWLSL